VVTNSYIGTNAAGTAALPNGASGVYILNTATNNTVGGGDVISGNAGDGVAIAGSGTTGNVVEGDFIGTNAGGTTALGVQYTGVYILDGASSNIIGDTTAAARDVISGNVYNGVYITGSGTSSNLVEGDFIGTDASGSHAVGQQSGVVLAGGASSNYIGTMKPGAGNVISGNTYGVEITDAGTMLNWVENDLIGTNASDTYAVANTFYGVLIFNGASYNGVYSNVISGNSIGVEIDGADTAGNYVYFNEIGTDQSGSIAIGNVYYGVHVSYASNTVIMYNTIEFSGLYCLVNVKASTTYYGNTVIRNGSLNNTLMY
jgi:titin